MATTKNGEIAQLARAHGSYPWCRGFESPSRYYNKKSVDLNLRSADFLCKVKWILKQGTYMKYTVFYI